MSHRILVVDDDSLMRDAISSILKSKGFLVTGSPNGDDALAKLRDDEFELVLSDIAMPGMSGLVLLDKIKALKPDLPVLMMTGTRNPMAIIQPSRYKVQESGKDPGVS
jgi:DNA-binding NtrC family response regulator